MSYDLTKIADSNNTREWMQTPFTSENHDVATNGHMIFVTKLSGKYAPIGVLESTQIKKMIKQIIEVKNAQPLKATTINLKTETCAVCKGTGHLSTCEECAGEGEVELSNNYSHYACACLSCQGQGELTAQNQDANSRCCSICYEGIRFTECTNIKIGKHTWINPIYLKTIEDLPNLKISEAPLNEELGWGDEPIIFTADEVSGMIMPMRPPS